MTQYKLWQELPQIKTPSFIADVKEGKVPELPFYIIDQEKAKIAIENKIKQIKGKRFQTSVLTANYGNGKTNILMYLKLFYQQQNDGITVIYYRADSDNFDIINNLLKIIEDNFTNDLINTVKSLRSSGFAYDSLAHNFQNNFGAIHEYTDKLFESDDDSRIKQLLYLGTGRLNSKRYFDREDLRPLRDYERREILVLFLNILAEAKIYLVFCIDEVEKIYDKSKARFSHFLTSLRELIDLSSKIKGHYLILAMTDKTDTNLIQITNEALHTRIHQDIIAIHPITETPDKKALIDYLKKVFDKTDKSTDEIFNKILKTDSTYSNRTLIQKISEIIFEQVERKELKDDLENHKLRDLFDETKKDLKINVEAFKNIHRKFFDPLEYYLESFNTKLKFNGDDYFRSQLRYYYNLDTEVLSYFIFSEDKTIIESEAIKIGGIIDAIKIDKQLKISKVSIFVPSKMELNYSTVSESENLINVNLKIVDIEDYEDLFTLLVMYREHFEKQKEIQEIIENYTDSSL